MELEEYITHLQGFGESLDKRAVQEIIVPAAQQLYASIKSRTSGSIDVTNTPGYYDANVVKKQTFLQQTKNLKPVNVKPVNIPKPVVADFEMEVQQGNVLLGLTQKGSNKSKYYATAQELDTYTKDVEINSEALTYKILKGQ